MNVTVICQGFINSSIHLQPWRHVHEVFRLMVAKGFEVTLLSDEAKGLPASEKVGGLEVLRLNHLMWLPLINKKRLLDVLKKREPDVIVWVGKPLSCVSLALLGFTKKPIVWIVESGVHNLRSLLGLSLKEILSRHHGFLWNEILNAIFPRFLIRKVGNSSLVKRVIVPSQYLENWLLKIGVPPRKVTVIPSALDEYYRNLPMISNGVSRTKLGFHDEDYIVTYMGSPCTLRGVDVVVRSIREILDKQNLALRCFLLSRGSAGNDIDHLKSEEKYLENLIRKLRLDSNVQIVSGLLSREELLQFIETSDVVVLPFKLLQSETPLSVLEVMSLGKVVVTTRIRTLEEIIGKDRGLLIESSEPQQLAEAILKIANGQMNLEKIKANARKFAFSMPSWRDVAERTISVLEEAVS